MKRLFFVSVFTVLYCACSVDRVEELICTGDCEEFFDTVIQWFDADKVEISRVVVKDGLFSRKTDKTVVVISNATMNALDFKLLPENYRISPGNDEEITGHIRGEGEKVAVLATEYFDLKGCTDLVVEFVKYNSAGLPNYVYESSYPELLIK